MYMNTTYKAFVAETAAKIAASIAGGYDDLTKFDNEEVLNVIAHSSVRIADKVAGELEDWWQAKNEHTTVMFDVEDSLTSRVEEEIARLKCAVEDTNETLKKAFIEEP